ncbi:type I polyketide synthase [Polyangium jinanense]|uniref:SDR family NAD(P)-dependent oxidoreductase n=1 Tax=Polyangium jinanense TaxID=2829994 RepID=A0A9X3X163_9BACT|nr:type I polyketide synthase [Polyangium jinanense]MDC3955567.1 SDR family NAD(P)-dependent oxidoreductase [Polyangium jinanense]MDC3982209.1 SDR family NAD(P)-dependent oxidoreductase [Polyangium jinanense]
MKENEMDVPEGAIAIIGMAGRFPGAPDLDRFWQNLRDGVRGISFVAEDMRPSFASSPNYVPAGGYLEDVDLFDASFFEISRREAELLDPQRRIFLECAWEALENAGIDPFVHEGAIGVYAGASPSSYLSLQIDPNHFARDFELLISNDKDYVPSYVGYKLNLRGPCVAIQTACSTSLVAVHVACASLLARECDVALAGGVTVRLPQGLGYNYEEGFILSPDGHCRTFDANGKGTLTGNGAGVVVLKRLEDAIADGDHIRAVIRGSAINNDGSSKVGFTAPSVVGQVQVIAEALAVADVDPSTIQYIEAHGTATSLGDAIEVAALKQAFSDAAKHTIALGALKASVGHTESAAGVGGLIKTVLAMEHGRIPAHPDFEVPNPELGLEDSPFYVRREAHEWIADDGPRRAGVSSFGIGGTNAHVVLEEAPATPEMAEAPEAKVVLLPLSAKSPAALEAMARSYATFLGDSDADLHDIAFTAGARRRHHPVRLAVTGDSKASLAEALAAYARGDVPPSVVTGAAAASAPKVVFVFPGQGSQWVGMGRALLKDEPAFREALSACDAAIRREAGFSVLAELAADESASRLGEIDVVQPVLFAIEVALAALWRSFGVEPSAVVGHSMGEVAAAYVAGALSLPDAARIICRRSKLLRKVSGQGAMALVELPMAEAEQALAAHAGRLSVAVSNGPRSTVIAGDPAALEEVLAELSARQVFCRRVKVDVASHSPQMDPLRPELLRALGGLRPKDAAIPMRSTVTGASLSGNELNAAYWVDNLRKPVRFSDVTQSLIAEGHTVFLEMSPHPILLPAVEENLSERGARGAAIASLRRHADERASLLESLGKLYVQGYSIDWKRTSSGGGRVVTLPAYPWQRERFWREPEQSRESSASTTVASAPSPKAAIRPMPRLHEMVWQDAPLRSARAGVGSWLLVHGGGGAVHKVEARLRQAGITCQTVDLSRGSDAVASTLEQARGLTGVVCLWNALPLADGASPAAQAESACIEALHFVRRLCQRMGEIPSRLLWVTEGANAVSVGDHVSPHQAALFGLGRAIMKERPELGCILVDVEPLADDIGERIYLELERNDDEDQVAWRKGVRRAARLAPARPADTHAAAARIAPESTVLVTGGLGALGLRVAQWLWDEHRVSHLVLVGRSEPTGDKLEAIEALRASGARVTVARADVADATHVDALLRLVPPELPLRGVIHSAAVLEDGLIENQDDGRFRRVLAPKMRGAWNLHEATRDLALDFFVLFSSAGSILGGSGQTNYCAANAFLDGLAHARKAAGRPAISLNWGPFEEIGLAAALGAQQKTRFQREGLGMLTPRDGLALLGQALGRSEAQLGALSIDLDGLTQGLAGRALPPLFRAFAAPSPARSEKQSDEGFRARLAGLSPEARRAEVEAAVRADVARVLSLGSAEKVPLDRPLRELGLDSLMALELRNRLAARVEARLSATIVFDHPTVQALSRFLLTEVMKLGEEVAPARAATPIVAEDDPIAIVGIGCRFPGGVSGPESFWELLQRGDDVIREVPRDRWNIDDYYDPDPDARGKMMSRWGGFIEGVDTFDPLFFEISPREAEGMDPQARLLLEVSFEALERAGRTQPELMGSDTGVFVGVSLHDYEWMARQANEHPETYVTLGTAHSMAVARLSYWLGLRGPNMPVDTACSSSLVAIHLACQALRAGECSLALAGGVNLMLTPDHSIALSRTRAMSPTGRCRSFSADADGFVRSDGCGVLVLERLSDAIRRGDRVLAVIRGTAINQDGRSNGPTAPNGPAQEDVIRRALAQAGLAPAAVDYVEAHGTGTLLGDPIEVQALGRVLSEGRAEAEPVILGSVKSNIGHTEAASGVAGLIKAVLSLQHGTIPRSIHCDTLNPHIPWENLPVKVATEVTSWPARGARRIAGVSAFGLSGTNAHAVLEEAPPSPKNVITAAPAKVLLPISSHDPVALSSLASAYADHLTEDGEGAAASLHDVAFSASTRRVHREHRIAVIGGTREDIAEGLRAAARGETSPNVHTGRIRGDSIGGPVFVFSGQGSQWAGMARGMFDEQPVFRESILACDALVQRHGGFSLVDALFAPEDTSRIHETEVAQPAIFAVEVALTALLRSWGVVPSAVIGHSVGELAAAHVSGALDLEEAVRIVCLRARIMQRATGLGKMLAVSIGAADGLVLLRGHEDRVGIAAINDPGSIVLAGDEATLTELMHELTARSVSSRWLRVNYAFHSPQMGPLADDLLATLGAVKTVHGPHMIAMYSTVSGERVEGGTLDAAYWAANVRSTVSFVRALESAAAAGHCSFVEVGPHPVLTQNIEQFLSARNIEGRVVPTLRRGKDANECLLSTVASLYVGGDVNDLGRLYPHGGSLSELPSYRWNRKRYWIDRGQTQLGRRGARSTGHPLLGAQVHAAQANAVFEAVLAIETTPYLSDHRVFGRPVVPGTALLELARAAAEVVLGEGAYLRVEGLTIQSPLVLPEQGAVRVQVSISDAEGEAGAVAIHGQSLSAQPGEAWTEHASGRFTRIAPPEAPRHSALSAIRSRCMIPVDTVRLYESFSARGVDYGPAFRGIREIHRGEGESLALLELPESAGDVGESHACHPALLDAALQTIGAAFSLSDDSAYLPFELGTFSLWKRVPASVFVHATARTPETSRGEVLTGDVVLLDAGGEHVLSIESISFKRADAAAMPAPKRHTREEWLYELTWPEKPLPSSSERPASEAQAGEWLLVGADSTLARGLAERLQAAGASSRFVDIGARDAFGAAIEGALESRPSNVVFLWDSQEGAPGSLSPSERSEDASIALLSLVQSLLGADGATPRLTLVTVGAHAAAPFESVDMVATSLWGLGRTIMEERPELGCRLVDLDPHGRDSLSALWAELAASDGETQVLWRGATRHVARLSRVADRKRFEIPDAPSYRLEIAQKGMLDRLHLVPAERSAPAPGEIEIEVKATGLNFRDVIRALGMDPAEGVEMGGECAGIVSAVGEGVTGFSVGDPVMAIVRGAFRRYTTVDARFAHAPPAGLSLEQSAAIPIVFLTAWYGLRELGRLEAGQSVLIHAAAGGVGMAAVQIAQWIGARVFATASPSKWDVVRAMGVEHVESSRSLAFADAFRAVSDGFDVVLDSLAGAFVDAGLSLTRSGGRFLEMGKTDIRSAEDVARRHPGVEYRAFDLFEAGPDRIQEMFRLVVDGFVRGHLRPLPVRVFPIEQAESAFRFMAQARHIGKIVVLPAPRRDAIAPGGAVLISGGLGALGLAVARWLWEEHHVSHLVLLGRSAPSGERLQAVEALRAAGARVTVAQADVADIEALRRVLDEMPPELPLRGVIHAAGEVHDAVIARQTPASFGQVFRAKVRGAWNLHEVTRGMGLDFFVLFSSGASLIGSAGQGNYAAANAFLDGLAHARRAEGLAAQSLNWGPWSGGGMADALGDIQRARYRRLGVGAISPSEGVALLGEALSMAAPQLGILPLDLRALGESLGREIPALWRLLVKARSSQPSPRALEGWAQKLSLLSAEARTSEVEAMVRREAARVLSLASEDEIVDNRPLQELGLDSLMAVELRNALAKRVGQALPATLLFDHPTVRELGRYLLDKKLAIAAPASAVVAAPRPRDAADSIAIVGMSCRFPGAPDPEAFWQLLVDEVDAIRTVPGSRWDVDALYDPDPDAAGKMTTRWGGFLDDIDRFDPLFFGISPREAASIDPQQRLLLETTWEALESAGIVPDDLWGSSTGVYVGICGNDYQAMTLAQGAERLDAYSLLGSAHSASVGRLSYWLGLKGPNLAVDTACSSALVAVHLACQALRVGECTLAVAGGVNLMLNPDVTVYFSRLRAMSPTGRCHAFSADADGYVRSEGCGVVVLKRLGDALRDGDSILAVIRGSSINQDGRSQGLTAPNGPSQEAVITQALAQANVSPSSVQYVEAHGTGTPLGDPIEVQALGAVLAEGRTSSDPVIVGSVKSNIGHTEGAAGVASMIKVVLSLQHQSIPRSLHFTAPNPHIPWSELPLKVASEATPWKPNGRPRIAGVSSFGFSGTNAHVVIEEAPRREALPASRDDAPAYLLTLSAKSPASLAMAARDHAEYLSQTDAPLADIVYTASARRAHHEHRLSAAGRTKAELSELLHAFVRGEAPSSVSLGRAPSTASKVVFVFSGQGSQWSGMAMGLLQQSAAFRRALEECDAALRPHTGFSVIDELSSPPERSRLDQTFVAQPVLFAYEVALAALYSSLGVTPDLVIGHSVGEIVAAHVAGILDLGAAARLVAIRGSIMQRATDRGRMVAVSLSEADARAALAGHEDRVGIAAVNDPEQVVLSGDAALLEQIVASLSARAVKCRDLRVKYAFHSPLMADLEVELEEALGALSCRKAAIGMISTVTGAAVDWEELTAAYWRRNMRQTVRFAEAISAASAGGHDLFLEVGAHPVLSSNVARCLAENTKAQPIAAVRKDDEHLRHVLSAVGALHAAGAHVDWKRMYAQGGRLVALPKYPWQRERYWIDTAADAHALTRIDAARTGHPWLGAQLSLAGEQTVFQGEVSLSAAPYLGDHRVLGEVLLPGTALVELARAAAAQHFRTQRVRITDLVLEAPMLLASSKARPMQVTLAERAGLLEATIHSRASASAQSGAWTTHAKGVARPLDEAAEVPFVDLDAVRARCREVIAPEEAYEALAQVGLAYGPAFRAMRELHRGPREALSHVVLDAAMVPPGDAYGLHPVLLDAALHTLFGLLEISAVDTHVPFAFGEIDVFGTGATEAYVHVQATRGPETSGASLEATVTLMGREGRVFAVLSRLRLRRVTHAALQAAIGEQSPEDSMFVVRWSPRPIQPSAKEIAGTWLAIGQNASVVDEIASRIRASGANCLARTVDEFTRGNGDARDASINVPIDGVVCSWGGASARDDGRSAAERAQSNTIDALHVLQTLLRREQMPRRLIWVTERAQSTAAGDPISIVQAPLWGLVRVFAKEYPDVHCTLVDLEEATVGEVDAMLGEIHSTDRESEVAYRGGQRFAARIVRAQATHGQGSAEIGWKEGTILITGGLGALGLWVARWAWEAHGAAHLLLVGRSEPTAAQLEEIERLRAEGAHVTVMRADVSEGPSVQALVDSIPAAWPLRGIVHAAGVLDDAPILDQTAARLEKVMAPKVLGAWNLHEATRGHKLDFFVSFSSATSLFGTPGQGNYAAANAFVDALAHHRRAEGLSTQAYHWGPFADRGMAANLPEAQKTRLARMGIRMLESKRGLALFGRALAHPEAELLLMPIDVTALGAYWGAEPEKPWSDLLATAVGQAPRRNGPLPVERTSALDSTVPAQEDIEAMVRAAVARVMSLEQASIAVDRPLQEFGLNSLMAVELRNALSKRIGKPLPATLVFDYPTVGALARYLLEMTRAPAARVVAAPPKATARPEEPIAIIGFGCRYPGGVHDGETFWRLLSDGVDAIGEVPKERWDIDEYFDPDPSVPGKIVTRMGGFLREIDQFDPQFFGISPREAERMDPQQRLLLETSFEALENAGIAPETLMGRDAGVFVGLMYHDYAGMTGGAPEELDGYMGTGNAGSIASGRLSYLLGLRGPSLTLDTACSSSLVAIHLACRSLRSGESSMALAGGVAVMLTPSTFIEFSRLGGLARDGRCKTFSASADGVAWSEGCGMLALKRLSDAERDGDPILAIIRGSAVNQDGKSQGLTAPNGPSQEQVIRRAFADAGIDPGAVDYVETHGTGTTLGDPIEASALGAVLRDVRTHDDPVIIGSLKSNIGHTQSAAGVGGVIKTLLAMRHGEIPRSLHFSAPSPHIAWSELPLKVASEAIPWKPGRKKRIAGVSSFGFSGTNAHVVLEEAPPRVAPPPSSSAPRTYLLPLSAKSSAALTATARMYSDYLARAEEDLEAIAYTASTRRSQHEHRLAVVGETKQEIAAILGGFVRGESPAGLCQGRASATPPKVVFVFPGQGSQWLGMGRELLEKEPAFREALSTWDAAIRHEAGFSVIDELLRDEATSRLGEIDVLQPVLVAVEVALASLWRSWGIEPAAVVGHSMGEVAAAFVAGMLSLEDAAAVICRRSRLMRKLSGTGAMALVELALDDVENALEGFEDALSVAASNGPRSTVISGEQGALAELLAKLDQRGVFHRKVKVDVASHSPQMDQLRDDLLAQLAGVRPRAGRVPMLSTVSRAHLQGEELVAAYWADNLRKPVLFSQVVSHWIAEGHTTFLEMSPHPILLTSVEENLRASNTSGQTLASLRRGQDERKSLLASLGALHTQGLPIAWRQFHPGEGRVAALPTYPWQHARYWMKAPDATPRRGRQKPGHEHELLGKGKSIAGLPRLRIFESSMRLETAPSYLEDHRVGDDVVFPAAGYVEMVFAAAHASYGESPVSIEGLSIDQMLALPPDTETSLQVTLDQESGGASVLVASRVDADTDWRTHATGRLVVTAAPDEAPRLEERPASLRARLDGTCSSEEHYEWLAGVGLPYGPAFQGVVDIARGEGLALGRVRLPGDLSTGAYRVHPALLDACLQVSAGLFDSRSTASTASRSLHVPVGASSIRLHARPTREVWVLAQPSGEQDPETRERVVDLRIVDDEGRVLLDIRALRLRPLHVRHRVRHESDEWMLDIAWRRAEPPADPAFSSSGTWLVFGDRGGMAARLAEALAAKGQRCVRVVSGDRFAKIGEDIYSIDVSSRNDHESIVVDVLGDGKDCRGVLHLFGLDAAPFELATPESLVTDLDHGPTSVVHLARALLAMGYRDMPRLCLVTRGAQGVGDDPAAISVSQAPIWGLGRTLALEHGELKCKMIDLPVEGSEDEVALLLREAATHDQENQVALRREGRYVARVARAQRDTAGASPLVLTSEGDYVITGGLGGLGLSLAQWMVDKGARHIVLVGRRGPDERAAAAIEAMNKTGANIRTVAADVSRREDVDRLLETVAREGRPLKGIVHAAAVLDDHTILELSSENFRRVFGPKALGAFHLHHATKHTPLDFFILYSSAASLFGSPGQGNYTAANAFLDALAHHRMRNGLTALDIQWGAFAEVGLAAAEGIRGARLSARGSQSLTIAEGFTALERLFERPSGVIGVVKFDIRQWLEFYPRAAGMPFFDALRDEQGKEPGPRIAAGALRKRLQEAAAAERASLLVEYLRSELSSVLRVDASAVDPAAPMQSMGVDSLTSLELRNRIEAGLEVRLSATIFFTYPTALALAEHLLGAALGPAEVAPAGAGASAPSDEPAHVERASIGRLTEQETEAAIEAELAALEDDDL